MYYTGLLMNIVGVFDPPSDAGDLVLDEEEFDFSLRREIIETISF
jgi:hypothetical protein